MVEISTQELFEKVKEGLPSGANISDIKYEGAEIVLYTKSKEFFAEPGDSLKNKVMAMKKRILLRPDASIMADVEKAKKAIEEIIPKEAGLREISFEPGFGTAIIEVDKPGIAIGAGGEILREIKRQIFWTPVVRRAPAIPSEVVKTLRKIIHMESEWRKEFLNKVGKRIHSGWKETDWIRMTALGAFREVGRSAVLLSTPESRILMDCGVKPGGSTDYPYLGVPEFDLNKLDSVVLSHAHMDHAGFIPWLYEYGCEAPLYLTEPSRDLMVMMCMDMIEIAQREGRPLPYTTKGITEAVKHCVPLEWGEVSDITPDMRLTLLNDGHILGGSLVHVHIGNGLHNVLYSLDWKSPVTIIDKENNIHIIEIGKFVDEYFSRNKPNLNGVVESATNFEGWKTVAFDPKTYESKIVEITSVLRHPTNEELYEIKTETGKDVIVSGAHSLFAAKGGAVFASEAKNLKEGDWIVGIREIKMPEKNAVVDLFEFRNKLRIKIDDEKLLNEILNKFENKLQGLKNREEIRVWLKDHFKEGLYVRDIAKKYRASPKRIFAAFNELGVKLHPRVKSAFQQKIKMAPDFARFLGYFVSEGSARENTVRIVNYDHIILEDACKIIKDNLKIEGKIRKKDNVVLFDSKQLKILLHDVLKCGNNAYKKRIPKEILGSSAEVFSQFIKGYFAGDGTKRVRDSGVEISATSKNKFLAQDVGFLLLRMGIQPTFQFNQYTGMHTVSIYGREKISRFFENVNLDSWKKLVEAKQIVDKKSSYSERIPISALSQQTQTALSKTAYQNAISCGISKLSAMDMTEVDQKLINSCFTFEKIKSIEKVKSTSKHVYDFQVEGFENFLGGNGFLFLHNTGDLKFDRTLLYDPASYDFARAETVITESTYGLPEDIQPRRDEAEAGLVNAVKKAIARNGKVLIPSFAVQRAQDIQVILAMANLDIPIYLDGMIWDVSALHTTYPEFMSREMQRKILVEGWNPFTQNFFKRVGSETERKKIIDSSDPAVVISTSGMLTGGPAVNYFKAFSEDKKNMIIFVGWQAENSLGRKIQKGYKEVPMEIDGRTKSVPLNMEVLTMDGLSGHSDYKQLMNYIGKLRNTPERIIANHGEAVKCVEFARNAHRIFKCETLAPRLLETVRLK